ncbi:hypothetical protein HAX54_042156 [Datura stramonium]|uniref:Uncharacterized protein n=1 Tax=Datura stramonium TaxID=4076 RepID=A0ABS8SLP9_DATST|nr:hypothetical protein [Datura stramonium]
MAVSPETMPENSFIDFRAPPPSPIASGRRSCVRNDEVLTEFLQNSLRVPDLVLPDRVFPRQKSIHNPSKLDFQSLASLNIDSISKILDSVATIGCFEVVNHGISGDLIKSVSSVGNGVFGISREGKAKLMRSSEKPYGFEEFHGEEERETSEDFVWCRGDQNFNKEMEGIWPLGFSTFSEKMEKLLDDMEDIGGRILQFLQQNTPKKLINEIGDQTQEKGDLPENSICYLHNHKGSIKGDEEYMNTLKYDVIRMLIRGSEFPHALCLHVSNGCSEFHVYSKKGWVSFQPDKDSLIVTIGDLLQRWSGGQYKHVIGRPVFQGQREDCISLALLISPPKINEDSRKMADFMETEEEFIDFTLAEAMEMTTLFKGLKEKPITLELCQELANKFSSSPYRTGKSLIKWEQVHTWFMDKQKPKAVKAPDDNVEPVVRRRGRKPKPKNSSSALVLSRKYTNGGYTRLPHCAYDMPQRPRVSSAEMGKELAGLAFEALSAKDLAWYDVGSFLNFRVLYSGELEVRVRFAGFGNEEDEWVNVKRGVRERSVPLEPSECGRLNVGDPVMCFREDEYLAVYGDAMVVEIQRQTHDITSCTCIFVVRYDLDNAEEKVALDKICCRPNFSSSESTLSHASELQQ